MSGSVQKTQNWSSKVGKGTTQKVSRQIKQCLVDTLFFVSFALKDAMTSNILYLVFND